MPFTVIGAYPRRVEPHFYVLVAIHGNYHRALAPAHIAFKVKDLLPCSEQRFALGDWQSQRWP
jgi:hypothetical protein